jgi:putative oxidoreductase
MASASSPKHADLGLLLLRFTTGTTFAVLGWMKLLGGPAVWQQLGRSLETFGIAFGPTVWGLLAALTELLGGIVLIVGFGARLAALALAGVMIVAVTVNLTRLDTSVVATVHSLLFSFTCLGVVVCLALTGPGNLALGAARAAAAKPAAKGSKD